MTENVKTIDQFVRENVNVCVSSLVCDTFKLVSYMSEGTDSSRMLRETGFDYDDMLSMMQSDDWESPAREHIRSLDRDDLIEALGYADITDDRDAADKAVAAHKAFEALLAEGSADPFDGDSASDLLDQWPGRSDTDLRVLLLTHLDEQADGWKDFCEDNRIDANTIEVYEHWAVTDFFGRKLKEYGETVVDFGNLDVWCRTTTGQAISMDHCIGEIYKDLMKED